MIERPKAGEKTLLVHLNFSSDKMRESLEELESLAESAGALVVEKIVGTRAAPDPKFFVGSGKANEIAQAVQLHQVELIIFNHNLTATQERNLERFLKCRVIDRTGLILDIFAQRARSFEGKLQVELALLKHTATRLVRGWTHLERQRGGIGLRGPGETQLETDRRLIKKRIQAITARLLKVRKQRQQSRRARQKAGIPTVALVGYTNAGKSTLFNRLTKADVYAADRLFATLDPTLRKVYLGPLGSIILADTVGFIRHLPHDLIDAFHATLEEVSAADLLLHVVDVADAERQANMKQVNLVLEEINADKIPQLLVYNKIDQVEKMDDYFQANQNTQVGKVFVSAKTGKGLSELNDAIVDMLAKDSVESKITLSPEEGEMRAWLFQQGAIIQEKIDSKGRFHLTIRMSKEDWSKFQSLF